ncbi:MAG TPA: hypothetical protein VHV31_03955 [Nitrolancea sp.]|nr:hypothetical protein [Nitrolancea sp.]
MKRISLAMSCLLLLIAVAACGGGTSNSTATTAAATTAQATATTASTASATPNVTETSAASPVTATTGAVATPAVQASATPSSETATTGSFAYGFNVYWRGDAAGADFNTQTINTVKDAGFTWVRIQIQWDQVERAKDQWDPLPIDRLVQQYQGTNVKILASVVKPPDWALDPTGQQLLANYSDWEGFMHFLAERYKGKIGAWEIWNEENLASEMGGQVRLQDYANLLQAGYNGVKLADPEAIVVFGGLTPTGVNDPKIAINDLTYLQEFYAFKQGYYTKFFDVLGMHVSATNNPPDKMYPDDPGTGDWSNDPSFYFRRAEQLHQVQVDNHDTRPDWITEFGWTTKNDAKGYEYGADNTPQDQADYLVQAFQYARKNWPWATGMFVWNLNYSVVVPPTDEKYPWAVINSDWSARPAYTALKAMPKN